MYTTTLTLTRAWLSDPLDPADNNLQCGTRTPSDLTDTQDGEFRPFAGNRVQLVVRELETLTRPIVFAALTPAQMQQVRDWKGKLLCLRTIDGERIFGAYLSVSEKHYYNTSVDGGATWTAYDATVTFTQVSFTESV